MGKPLEHHVLQETVGKTTWGMRSSFQWLAIVLIAVAVIGIVFSAGEGGRLPEDRTKALATSDHRSNNDVDDVPSSSRRCDLFSGRWVFDDLNYPLYREKECSFMSDQLACQKFGRKDLSYQFWRWQPHHCDLPRFNNTALLERLRNRRLVFVGDSINRGQWVSTVCLVDKIIPPSLKSMNTNGSLTSFKAIEYNASIEFYWAPLLVESNSDDPVKHRLPDRIVRVGSIEKHARHWTNADILVFNSYLWWIRPTLKVLRGTFESPDEIYEMEKLQSYEMALKTWSDWIEIHVNHSNRKLFWVSMSPTHERSEEWGATPGLNCYNETEPIFRYGYGGSGSDRNMMQLVERTIGGLKTKGINVQLLNITQLSEYRKEAHPSIYRKQWEPLTQEQLSSPGTYADCFHWCLPGVPDTWNQLLYAYLMAR
ncbi:hypothetical protein Nepgr_028380 [Nepenthes gracilis]|uniref:Trichome birefringence-like N-terminal domain-containing protein n=1 Tax=Nepenthes gracilis TaxID=150966 RepID=A0AAD3TDK7_NEPGR|nr:hypothetical protein Nepgr_028380 [Nepenthes gracilis]